MIVRKLVLGAWRANCYIVGSETAREGLILDPGDGPDEILLAVKNSGLKISALVATHGHPLRGRRGDRDDPDLDPLAADARHETGEGQHGHTAHRLPDLGRIRVKGRTDAEEAQAKEALSKIQRMFKEEDNNK